MRKTFLILATIVSTTTFAQLKVDNSGSVSIGNFQDSQSALSIRSANDDRTNGNSNVLYLKNDGKSQTKRRGIYLQNELSEDTVTIGIYCQPNISTSSNARTYGIQCFGGGSHLSNYGVWGGLWGTSSDRPTRNGAGIFGTSSSSGVIASQYRGLYGGYFVGDVRVTGKLYANIYTPSGETFSSPSRNSKSIIMVNDEESVCENLGSLQTVQLITTKSNMSNKESKYVNATDLEENIETIEDIEEVLQLHEMPEIKHCLIASQLREIYPELVHEDSQGNLSINYVEMVPLLVQSINELSNKIKKLESNTSLVDEKTILESRERSLFDMPMSHCTENEAVVLYQNTPNPFSESSTIKIDIPSSTNTAALLIYDMSGKQLQSIDITERGNVSVSITSESLSSGMYLYTLIADGKITNTKKMIIN